MAVDHAALVESHLKEVGNWTLDHSGDGLYVWTRGDLEIALNITSTGASVYHKDGETTDDFRDVNTALAVVNWEMTTDR